MSTNRFKVWIEAIRLRTLPVSLAGVVTGCALANMLGAFRWPVALLCVTFALLAQISSNFANEYFDYRDGLDRVGRVGPRRGVTEGDISPRAMLTASLTTLGVACIAGLLLIIWGGWLLLPVGIVTAAGAMAYSAGPYPLSRHALGEVAVIIFFGIVPVNMVVYITTHHFFTDVAMASVAIGLMSANILIVNNYRDIDDDAAVGKTTLSVKIGRHASAMIYLMSGFVAMALMIPVDIHTGPLAIIPTAAYLTIHVGLWKRITRSTARALNPMLGLTALNLLTYTILLAIITFL